MSEWLRRQTRNLLGLSCAGSNPAVDDDSFCVFPCSRKNSVQFFFKKSMFFIFTSPSPPIHSLSFQARDDDDWLTVQPTRLVN
jgi:hypothetical protein